MNLWAPLINERERAENFGNAQIIACIGALFGTLAPQPGDFAICRGMNGDTSKA